MKTILIPAAILFFLGSCVSMKQYKDLETEKNSLSSENTELQTELTKSQEDNADLLAETKVQGKTIEELVADTLKLSNNIKNLHEQNEKLSSLNNSLKNKQSKMVQESAEEAKRLLSEIQTSREKLQIREDELNQLQQKLKEERNAIEVMKNELGLKDEQIQAKDKKLVELETMIRAKDSATNALKNKITSALLAFDGDGLSIEQRNGKIYLLLDEQLLFKVGKSTVNPKGVEALKKIASVLEKNVDIDILVEGHTDNTGSSNLNWKLSTERALSITDILLSNSKIEPKRITAAGRGQYSPIDTADTDEARKKNRRSEIILTPKLDELFDIIKE